MGSLALSDFRDELTVDLENRNDAALTDARKDRYINFAYRHMCRPSVKRHEELFFRYDFSLTTGLNEYVLSEANVLRKIIDIVDVTYFEATTITGGATRRDLRPRTLQWMNSRTKPNGAPSAFARTGSEGEWILILNTLPTSTENGRQVRVSCYVEPELLSDDTDTTVLGDYWDLVLKAGALFFTKWFLGPKEEAVADGQFYQGLINETAFDMELGGMDTDYQAEVESESYMDLGVTTS